ncbi:hypothetical protein F5Y16DRAFT_405155 [Xylariaceae sp. FL0255]|nr:hypothetical protein F5Y16DRAFT_405155 [Xylariaceae sp. FL0255]
MSLRHRDAFGRVSYVDQVDAGQEHYLRPQDGRLAHLHVQGAHQVHGSEEKSWARTGPPRSRVSSILHLARWTYSSVLIEGTEERNYSTPAVIELVLKWIPSCLILVLLLVVPQNLEGVFKNSGFYDPIQYRDWRYPKVSRNRGEGEQETLDDPDERGENRPLLAEDIEMTTLATQVPKKLSLVDEDIDEEFDNLPARHFRPRYLCFLRDGPGGPNTEYETHKVTDWINQHGDFASTDFVFISYTRKQFLVSAEAKWRGQPVPDEATKAAYNEEAQADRNTMLSYGMQAAREAGKRAFWLDFECIRDIDNIARDHSQSDDVYRICDIVRAAHSLVIVVGPPLEATKAVEENQVSYDPVSITEWLQQWGERLWTLPEVLLCSPEHRVKIYVAGWPNPPEEIAKRNIPGRAVWHDAKLVRNLIDHYESSVHLTPLELVSIALECFSIRTTDQFSDGDISYALMGLLRRRPAVVKSDKSFEAFARLSLANDSDKLLERLICMQPTRRDAPWHKIRDAWGVRLWDIEPRCQVAGIVDDQTVTLDGAFGATIQWDKMEQVAFLKRPTISRLLGKILLRGVPAYLLFALVLTITGGVLMNELKNTSDSDDSFDNSRFSTRDSESGTTNGAYLAFLIIGVVFLVPSVIILFLIPVMLLNIYQGKFWSTQAHFLGIEGIPEDIGEIERLLFGFNYGRLKWSTAGSILSRNRPSENGERVGLTPARSVDFNNGCHDRAVETGQVEETFVFTLIDTYSMTATAFRAARPPSTVIVCGHEGGMQRAILCSYDWKVGAFVREAIIRVPTLVLDRMFRVDRFRFALSRKTEEPGKYVGSVPDAAYARHQHKENHFWDRWKIDLAFLPFMFFVWGLYSPKFSYFKSPELVGFLLAQPINYIILFRKIHMGNLIASVALIKGITSIISNVITSDPGLFVLDILMGVADGVAAPAFVYLTSLWYDGAWGRMLRIIIWAAGPSFLIGLAETLAAAGLAVPNFDILAFVLAALSIVLSIYASFVLGTPEEVPWLWESQRSLSAAARLWKRTGSMVQISTLAKRVHTHMFIVAFFLVAASVYLPLSDFQLYIRLPTITLLSIFPLLIVLALGVVFAQYQHAQLPIIIILLALSFAGKIEISDHLMNSDLEGREDGLLFLQSTGNFALILTWALLLTNMVEPEAFLGTLCLSFTGTALGQVTVGAYIAAIYKVHDVNVPDENPIEARQSYRIAMTVLFALAVVVLVSWAIYRWLSEQRNGQSDVLQAGVYHQHVAEDRAIDDGSHSQMAIVSGHSQAGMFYDPDLPYHDRDSRDPMQPETTHAGMRYDYSQGNA